MPRFGGQPLGKGGEVPKNAWGNKIFESYLTQLGNEEDLFTLGLNKVQQHLAHGDNEDEGWCLICLGPLGSKDAIWSCSDSCFSSYHLNCIQDWAKASGSGCKDWNCPKCRRTFSSIPDTYLCYCSKVERPKWDPWIEPHSCGESCGKSLVRGGSLSCGHSCLLLCHPGTCPPCPQTVKSSCHCGKKSSSRRCGLPPYSCMNECGLKLEGCGHPCSEPCHLPPCPPCTEAVPTSCGCGSITDQPMPCHQSINLTCSKICNKALVCGKHLCSRACHLDSCGPCPSSLARSCPCGSSLFPNLTCDNPDPGPCGRTCGKKLGCLLHTCEERCHMGPCPGCKTLVLKNCRCGKTSKEALCGADLLCERKCSGMKACGRHACKRRCCAPGSCPPCEETCGKWLKCGNHKCPSACHAGPCRPCPLTLEVSCACGSASVRLPCGSEKRMREGCPPPLRCLKPCPVPSICRHVATLPPHHCHYGPCPPCQSKCGSIQSKCGHKCSLSCHDPRQPDVPNFIPPTPPAAPALALLELLNAAEQDWDAASTSKLSPRPSPSHLAARNAAALLGSPTPCPPCLVPVWVQCHGLHEASTRACHQSEQYSCGRGCGRMLPCLRHTCKLLCHPVSSSAVSCESSCGNRCSLARVSCRHPCTDPCHSGPCSECLIKVSSKCHCSRKTLSHPCYLTSSNDVGFDLWSCKDTCHKLLPSCQHPCRKICHPGACESGGSECTEEVNVRCPCRRRKEKWPCHHVVKALLSGDSSSVPKLLTCDEGCLALAASSHKPTEQDHKGDEAKEVRGVTVVEEKDPPPFSGDRLVVSKKRISKAEREELNLMEAARKEKERMQAQRKKAWKEAVVWLGVIVVGLALGLGLFLMNISLA
jgi:NF-X1-type zinc finger protein NFXL1